MSNVAKIIEGEFKRYEERNFKVTALHADNAFDNEEIKNIEEDYEKNLNQGFDSLIDLTYKIDTNQVYT